MNGESYNKCLPGMYPRHRLPGHAPESEGKVYSRLAEALPPNWYAWHSIKMRTDQGGLVEGDFLIADPAGGVLVLEVKGGVVSKQDGTWIQNGRPMKHDPMRQAVWCRASLVNLFNSRRMRAPAIGEAVCFPDTEYEVPPSQGDLQGRVIGSKELPYLKEALPELMEKATARFRGRKADKGWVKVIFHAGYLHFGWEDQRVKAAAASQPIFVGFGFAQPLCIGGFKTHVMPIIPHKRKIRRAKIV